MFGHKLNAFKLVLIKITLVGFIHAQTIIIPPFTWKVVPKLIHGGVDTHDFEIAASLMGWEPSKLFYDEVTSPDDGERELGGLMWVITINKQDPIYKGFYSDLIYSNEKAPIFGGIVPTTMHGFLPLAQNDDFYSEWVDNKKTFDVYLRIGTDKNTYKKNILFYGEIQNVSNDGWIILRDSNKNILAILKEMGKNIKIPDFDYFVYQMHPGGPFDDDKIKYPIARLKYLLDGSDYQAFIE
jgi:hypothetical protein